MAKEGKAPIIGEDNHQKMLSSLENDRHSARNRAIYLLGYHAGLRIGTIAGLRLDDVVREDGTLRDRVIGRSKIMKGSKTTTLYLNHPSLQKALKNWINIRPNTKVDSLFVSQKGKQFSSNVLSQMMLRLFKKADVEGSAHSMRRDYATRVLRSGADIVALKTLLNHSSISTTQHYVEHNDEYLSGIVGNI